MKLEVIQAERAVIEQRKPFVRLQLKLPEEIELNGAILSGNVFLRVSEDEFVRQFGDGPAYHAIGLVFDL